jgi:hypothetical protein
MHRGKKKIIIARSSETHKYTVLKKRGVLSVKQYAQRLMLINNRSKPVRGGDHRMRGLSQVLICPWHNVHKITALTRR